MEGQGEAPLPQAVVGVVLPQVEQEPPRRAGRGRDPRRKLAWGDRLFGTMRVALSQAVEPHTLALGAAAAVDYALRAETGIPAAPEAARRFLLELWKNEADDGLRERCLALAVSALGELAP